MKAGDIDIGAPVAAIQRVGADEVQRPADDRAVMLRHHQQHAVGHGGVKLVKHALGQIGPAPFAVDGGQVEPVEMVDMRSGDVVACQAQQPHAGFSDGAAFLPDVLALA